MTAPLASAWTWAWTWRVHPLPVAKVDLPAEVKLTVMLVLMPAIWMDTVYRQKEKERMQMQMPALCLLQCQCMYFHEAVSHHLPDLCYRYHSASVDAAAAAET